MSNTIQWGSLLAQGLGLSLLGGLSWVAFGPSPIDPIPWNPPISPGFEGDYSVNTRLYSVERLAQGQVEGPEDVDVDAQGRIYVGAVSGELLRFNAQGQGREVLAHTGGRPLGLDFDAAGALYIADATQGLLRWTETGGIEKLVQAADGVPFKLTDDVEVGSDGRVYFTDASLKFSLADYVLDLLEARPNGRLLVYEPTSGETSTLRDGLYFANGVAVSPDASYVLVSETGRYRITRVWLQGEKAGQSESILDNLPSFPDGISSNGRGVYWVALASPRQTVLDVTMPYPFLRKLIVKLPPSLQPGPEHYGMVLGISGEGKVLYNLQDPNPNSYSPITSVEEKGGQLYLGSLSYPAVGRVPVPSDLLGGQAPSGAAASPLATETNPPVEPSPSAHETAPAASPSPAAR